MAQSIHTLLSRHVSSAPVSEISGIAHKIQLRVKSHFIISHTNLIGTIPNVMFFELMS